MNILTIKGNAHAEPTDSDGCKTEHTCEKAASRRVRDVSTNGRHSLSDEHLRNMQDYNFVN